MSTASTHQALPEARTSRPVGRRSSRSAAMRTVKYALLLLFLCIVTVHDDGRATVNLRAPLVINPASMRGIQFVTPESPYRIDHPLKAA